MIAQWINDAKSRPDTRYAAVCDGMRVLTIAVVAWFHIWQQSWLFPYVSVFGRSISLDPLVRSGYMWVDLMILMSGFCLYLPYADGTRRMDARAFYIKRLIRVHPSYLLAIGIALCAALKNGLYATREAMLTDLLTHLTYTHMFTMPTYYASNLGGALWTLALLMQLYLLFPLLVRGMRRLPELTLALMLVLPQMFRAAVGTHMEDVSMYFNQLPAYLDTFALGMAGAAAYIRTADMRRGPISRLLCTAGAVCCLAVFWQLAKAQAACPDVVGIRLGQLNRRTATSLTGLAFLLCSANAGLVWRSLLGNRVMRFLASISMQFYIWHQTLAVWILQSRIVPSAYEYPNYDGDHAWQVAYTAVCVAVGLAVSALITYGFEKPVARRLSRLITNKTNTGGH